MLLSDPHATVGEHRALEGLVGLHTDDAFEILINIACTVRSDGADCFGVGIEHATRFEFLCEEHLELVPELIGLRSWLLEEGIVT